MSLHGHEVIRVNLVLMGLELLSEANQVNAFSEAVGTEVTPGANLAFTIPSGTPEPVARLELSSERIALEIGINRTIIERSYPSADDLQRLAEVAILATDTSELNDALPGAYGFNLEMVYHQDSGEDTFNYLGNRLFGNSFLAIPEWTLVGGIGRQMYTSPAGRWDVLVEPRFQKLDTKKVFLRLNLHVECQAFLDHNQVLESLEGVWDQAHEIVQHIDEWGQP